MRKRSAVLIGVFAAGLVAGWLLTKSGIGQPAPVPAPPLPAPLTPEGQNGLSENERATFYHLSEGGELFPVDWFLALEMEGEQLDEGGIVLDEEDAGSSQDRPR